MSEFRWWTFRKHLKQIPDGFIVTEFLPPVPWAGLDNSINCPAGHHFYEGRWLHDPQFLDDTSVFWFRKGGDLLFDKTGERYGRGKGLQVLVNRRRIAGGESLQRVTTKLP